MEKNINICGASLNGGKSPSAIYDLIKGRTKCSKVSTIKSFCQGAGITLSEFFDREYFNDFEGEIKSLGAWGGDFFLVATEWDEGKVKKYFDSKDLNIVFRYNDIVL